MATQAQSDALAAIARIVGPAGRVADDAADYLREPRGLFQGGCDLIVRPASTHHVSRILTLCAQAGLRVFPRGGGSSLVGGSVPSPADSSEARPAVVISLDRLNRIRQVEPADNTLVAEAGCTLAQVQDAATAAGRRFGLSLTPRQWCQIGGNLATNAGGMMTLRFGNARAQALGLEVVLPDGRVLHGLRRLPKDNMGYDLTDLFIGAEGTLGLITAASLRLHPQPRQDAVALAGLDSPAAALDLLARLRDALGDSITACELMSRRGVAFAVTHLADVAEPLAQSWPWYVLVAADTTSLAFDLAEALDDALDGLQREGIARAYRIGLGESGQQRLWDLRTGLVKAQRYEGASIKHDVSVPVSDVPAFIAEASAAVAAYLPEARPVPFGHVGDGNIHFNVSQPPGWDPQAFLALWDEMNAVVHGVVRRYGGSIAAEHGIGQLKRGLLAAHQDPAALSTMAAIKRALDPQDIMNPGRGVPRDG